MAPPPASPTSLLWAHQLKREHAHLLKRMQDLESANEKQESRLKTAENAVRGSSTSNADLAALAKQIKALDGGGMSQRLSNMERDVSQKLDSAWVDSAAMAQQISALRKDEHLVEDERRKALQRDKDVLKRVSELERELEKYALSNEQIGKRLNESQIEQIQEKISTIMQNVNRDGAQRQQLADGFHELERAHAELKKGNAEMEAKLKKVSASTGLQQPTTALRKALDMDKAMDRQAAAGAALDKPQKKKGSHKWSGGGADKDIISQGSSPLSSPATTSRRSSRHLSFVPGKTHASRRGPTPRVQNVRRESDAEDLDSTVRKSPRVSATSVADKQSDQQNLDALPKKSHRSAGGGVDKAVLQAGAAAFPEPNHKRPSAAADVDDDEPPLKKARTSNGRFKGSPVATPVDDDELPLRKARTSNGRFARQPGSEAPTKKKKKKTSDKSHKWNGGGADKDVIQAGFAFEQPTVKDELGDGGTTHSRVGLSGKRLLEIQGTPAGSDGAGESTQRKVNRDRKAILPKHVFTTKHARNKQAKETAPAQRGNKEDQETGSGTAASDDDQDYQQQTTISKTTGKAGTRPPAPLKAFSSPVTALLAPLSDGLSVEWNDVQGAFQAEDARQAAPTARRRRQIKQIDDISTITKGLRGQR